MKQKRDLGFPLSKSIFDIDERISKAKKRVDKLEESDAPMKKVVKAQQKVIDLTDKKDRKKNG